MRTSNKDPLSHIRAHDAVFPHERRMYRTPTFSLSPSTLQIVLFVARMGVGMCKDADARFQLSISANSVACVRNRSVQPGSDYNSLTRPAHLAHRPSPSTRVTTRCPHQCVDSALCAVCFTDERARVGSTTRRKISPPPPRQVISRFNSEILPRSPPRP